MPWLYPVTSRVGSAVRVFFVLSGFIITHLLLREEARNGAASLIDFYRRRAYRILPVITVYLAFLGAMQVSGFISVPFWSYIASATFWRTAIDSHDLTEHLWSLSVEEQFYLVWPFIFVYVRSKQLRIGICVLTIVAALFYWHCYLGNDDIEARKTSINFVPITVGVLAAILMFNRNFHVKPTDRMQFAALAVGALGIACLMVFHYPKSLLHLCCHAYVAVVICFAAYGNGTLTRTLEFWPLKKLGVVSYSLYVWQFPWAFEQLSQWPWWARAASVVGTTLLSYWWIECRFLALSRRTTAEARQAG